MAESATISWPTIDGATYKIEYKKRVDSTWILAADNITESPYIINGLESNVLYDFGVTTHCESGDSTRRVASGTTPSSTIWIADTFVCEQDEGFSLDLTVTGLSTPLRLIYDNPLERYYVIDGDDTNGNFWWFNPSIFVNASGRNYISGQPIFSPSYIQAADTDKDLRRLYAAGPQTNGLIVYDIAADTFYTVAYGTNGAYSRLLVKLLGNTIYCSNAVGTPSISLIDRSLLAVSSTVSIVSIPSGGTYFNNGYSLNLVNGNIWVTAASNRTNGNIAIYNQALSTLVGTITLPGVQPPVWSSGYWQNHFYDEEKNTWYAHDIGSDTLHIINTLTNTIVHTKTFDNKQGKNQANLVFDFNGLTGELYTSYIGLNSPADSSPILRYYRINRDNYDFENMIVGSSAIQLTNRTGTSEFWSISGGSAAWDGGGGWMSDGNAFKYSQ